MKMLRKTIRTVILACMVAALIVFGTPAISHNAEPQKHGQASTSIFNHSFHPELTAGDQSAIDSSNTGSASGYSENIRLAHRSPVTQEANVRKSVVDLTPEEKHAFVNALQTLKHTYPEGSQQSIYDRFVAVHVAAMGLMFDGAQGPAAGHDAPDIKGRLEILKVHARNKKLDPSVSLEVIARRCPGFTGADLANLLNEAAILTARRRKEAITNSEIDDAVDRVVAGMEGTPLVDSKSKRLIAYHEVGHAIVGTLLKDHDPVQKVTLIPRGQAQGLTWFIPNEEQGLITRSQLKARITGALGGRAAEDIIFGSAEVTTGAGGDLQQVTGMARQMVTRFGMSDLGPMSLESQTGEVFLGRDWMSRSDYSEAIAARIDAQVRGIVDECYQVAKKIVREHRTVMDRLVDLLIEKESIDGEEFRQIVAEYTTVPEKQQYIPTL
ncbi:hypothetical protein NUACC21_21700 [Scytonema sp. NUACC21]